MKLLKHIFIIVIICQSSFQLHAQISLGSRVGFHVANPWFSSELTEFESTKRTSTHFGIVANFEMNKNISLQSELLYLQKGYDLETKTEALDDSFISKNSVKVAYVEIPFLLKLQLEIIRELKIHFTVGPSLGIPVRSKEVVEFTEKGQTFFRSIDVNFGNKIDTPEFSIHYGVGLSFPIKNNNLNIDFRYLEGRTELFDDSTNSLEVKNRGISVSLGFLIPLTKYAVT